MNRMLKRAINFARQEIDPNKHFHFGAIAIRADGAIVQAKNERVKTPFKRAHAEARLVAKCTYGSIMYVARVFKDGTPAMAKPCKSCELILKAFGIKKVYYTIAENEYGVLELNV